MCPVALSGGHVNRVHRYGSDCVTSDNQRLGHLVVGSALAVEARDRVDLAFVERLDPSMNKLARSHGMLPDAGITLQFPEAGMQSSNNILNRAVRF
jgi:hypothetical protein